MQKNPQKQIFRGPRSIREASFGQKNALQNQRLKRATAFDIPMCFTF
jgi:hypothetical protein